MFATIEDYLIKHGHVGLAVIVQNIAKGLEDVSPAIKQERWIKDQLREQAKAMALIQAEIYFSEEIKALEKLESAKDTGLTEEERTKLSRFKEQLSFIGDNWWRVTNDINRNQYKKPKGPYIRNYELYQRGYLTYTEEELQRACKSLGGCCAWGCGCCYRVRESLRVGDVLMHCTKTCACCIRRRPGRYRSVEIPGFENDEEDEKARGMIALKYYSSRKSTDV